MKSIGLQPLSKVVIWQALHADRLISSTLQTPRCLNCTQNSKFLAPNSQLKTQNSKLKTQNSKLKTQNSKLKT
ncbi:hypothetical protein AB3R30_26600, partial [Leptolyngbyaceae cyanobacterium UHCC 1019]